MDILLKIPANANALSPNSILTNLPPQVLSSINQTAINIQESGLPWRGRANHHRDPAQSSCRSAVARLVLWSQQRRALWPVVTRPSGKDLKPDHDQWTSALGSSHSCRAAVLFAMFNSPPKGYLKPQQSKWHGKIKSSSRNAFVTCTDDPD